MERQKLGDIHNFGRYVYREGNWIVKPRETYWEEIFLQSNSKFSLYLQSLFSKFEINPLASFPNLTFFKKNKSETCINFLELSPLDIDDFTHEACEDIGFSIASMAFFGMTDLHRQNILLGKDSNNKIIFGPIDIECILNELTLLSQTLLLSPKELSLADCGLGQLDFYIREYHLYEKIPVILAAFMRAIDAFEEKKESIYNYLRQSDIENKKIRVILTSTRDYYKFLSGQSCYKDILMREELDQLQRKDMPYFFRYANDSHSIYQFSNNLTLTSKVHISRKKRNLLKLGLELNENIKISAKDDLKNNSALQLCRFFFRDFDTYSTSTPDLKIHLNNRMIEVVLKSGKRLSCSSVRPNDL